MLIVRVVVFTQMKVKQKKQGSLTLWFCIFKISYFDLFGFVFDISLGGR